MVYIIRFFFFHERSLFLLTGPGPDGIDDGIISIVIFLTYMKWVMKYYNTLIEFSTYNFYYLRSHVSII